LDCWRGRPENKINNKQKNSSKLLPRK
jgi:hypothetical protein